MRNGHIVLACLTAGLMLGPSGLAQSGSGQAVPDAPQPQKKPPPKAQPTQSPSIDPASPPTQPATKDDNAFPDAVSRQAAKEAAAAGGEAPDSTKKPTADDNPFPEAVSRQAAKDAHKAPDQTPPPPPRSDLPPGVSSSNSRGDLGPTNGEPPPPQEPDPVRAKKDIDVGGYYLKRGDYQGALQRFKDATASDPINVDAIFGLAESQRMLRNNAEAERNYQMYLEIVPNGSKAKQALKALKELHSAK
jgi:tetratricopeptide (TPR) repeat protein